MGVDNKTPEFLKMNPNGQVPTMMTPDGPLFESNAMAKYVARKGNDKGLYGSNDYEASQVDQWVEFFRSRIEESNGVLIGPLLGYSTFDQAKHDKAKDHVLTVSLPVLNSALEGKKYLVGGRVTVADIILVVSLTGLFSFILTREDTKSLVHLNTWFDHCVQLPHFKKILGEVKLCQAELPPGALKH